MSRKLGFSAQSGAWERCDYPAELKLRFGQFDDFEFYIIEEDAAGNCIDESVPFQLDQQGDSLTLTFLMKGITAPNQQRRFVMIEADNNPTIEPLIQLDYEIMHEEQESYRITTPAATYVYHKYGAGFASMFDPDGNDWLSYRPYGGSDGKYRGIPNLAYPENHFHPGGTGCKSEIISPGPLKVKIASESLDGKWACTWEIFPTFARLTVHKVDHPYWFLYEGTPGGKLDEAGDYCVRSDGVRLPLTERWALPLPSPEWVYYGAANMDRVLLLLHHEADDHIDSFWPMEHNMTVFGFGRNGIERNMTQIPAQFSIAFVEDGSTELVKKLVQSILNPVETKLDTP